VRWFDAAVGGNLLQNGETFLPTEAGTYYAETYINGSGCESQTRTVVKLRVEYRRNYCYDQHRYTGSI